MRLLIYVLILILSAGLSCGAAEPVKTGADKMQIPDLPPHPRLLLSAKGIAEMKARVKECDWAKARWEAIKTKADQELGKEIVLPPRGGNWFHWYACPVHGCALSTGKQIGEWQWEHKCPVGGEILLGDPSKASKDYDGCRLSNIHGSYSAMVLQQALAYSMTGEMKYANKARDIVLAYADKYLSYPIHDNMGGTKPGARIGSQNLDESTWLIPVCQGLDLIWDTLTQEEKSKITEKLLLPAAKDVIMPTPHGVHNIQCWRNSAIGLVGFLIGNKELIDFAVSNPGTGFRTQMEKGVSPDGCWYEGAWGYHFYTMSAIWPLLEAAHNCGIDLYCQEYKRMFDAPVEFSMPNLALPAFNDSGQQGVGGAIFELAYARYKDPLCLEVLERSNRQNDMALLFGEPKLPAAPKEDWRSANYPRSGYAILANGKGEQATWLCMKYGPHGGGHSHPDKLNFVLYAKGQVIGYDPGTTRYGLPLQKEWHRTTLAHNTLTVDGHSQKPAEGKCLAFGTEKGVDYVMCNAGGIYDGVDFTRTVAMPNENLIVFIDQVRSDKEHTYDLAYHERGAWASRDGAKWTPDETPGYMHLKDGLSWETDKGTELACVLKQKDPTAGREQSVVIGLAGGEPTDVITATGVGSNVEDRVPVVILRRRGKETTYIWCISLDGRPAKMERLPADGGAAVAVTSADGKWVLVANPEKKPVSVKLLDGSTWKTEAAFAVK